MHKVLIIGVGSIGERHLRCFGKTGRATVSLCEVNADLRETVREHYNVERAYSDMREALSDGYDAAVICAPAHLHIRMGLALADAGIHMLIEKPLSTSTDDVTTLIDKVAANNLKAAVAYVYRSHPVLTEMKAAIDEGRIGKPRQLFYFGGQNFPHFRPAYREIYYTRRETGGGAIQDAITHLVNAGEWLVGPIDRLACDASHQVLEGVDVEDSVHMITRQGDVMGTYNLGQYHYANHNVIQVHGDKGTAEFLGHESRWRWMDSICGEWHEQPAVTLERDDMFIAQANQFLDVLDGNAPPRCSLEEGLQTLRVNLAALKASDEHVWVEVR